MLGPILAFFGNKIADSVPFDCIPQYTTIQSLAQNNFFDIIIEEKKFRCVFKAHASFQPLRLFLWANESQEVRSSP